MREGSVRRVLDHQPQRSRNPLECTRQATLTAAGLKGPGFCLFVFLESEKRPNEMQAAL